MLRQSNRGTQAGVKRARARLHRADLTRSAFEQIGTPHITHKDKVPAQQTHRLSCTSSQIRHQKAHVLRRVPGGENGFQLNVADAERVAIMQEARIRVTLGPFKLRDGPAFRREIRHGFVTLHQLARTAEVVRMDVRIRYRSDPQIVVSGDLQVTVNIPFRVNDDCLAGALAPDQIGILREGGVSDLPEKHGFRTDGGLLDEGGFYFGSGQEPEAHED